MDFDSGQVDHSNGITDGGYRRADTAYPMRSRGITNSVVPDHRAMARTATLVFFVLLTACAGVVTLPTGAIDAQADPEPTERWNRTYGGSGDDIFADIARTDDGGYVLAGETERSGTGIDAWVVKIGADGETEWERSITGQGTDRLYSVVTTDDGYVVAGRTDRDGQARGWVLELGRDGSTQNERTPGVGAFYGIEHDGDGYVLAGWTRGESGPRGWLLKLDGSGSKAWEKTYAAPEGYSTGRLKAVVPTSNGYLLAGEVDGGSQDAWALRVGNEGELRWQRTRGGSAREAIWAAAGEDDGIVLAGESESGDSRDGWILRYDANGELAWEERFGGERDDWLDSAMRTDDGGYLFTGATLTGGIGSADGYVVKTDSAGTMQWETVYGSSGWDKPWPAIRAHGGGYILAGQTSSFDTAGKDGWVLALGPDGQVSGSTQTTGDETGDSNGSDDGATESTTSEERASDRTTTQTGKTSLPGFTAPVALVALTLSVLLWRRYRS
ncbi:hypothetical protein [Haladaptatus sp. NG-SE-30]